MQRTLIALCVVFGMATAVPISTDVALLEPADCVSLILKVVGAVVGSKFSAIGIAVKVIAWIVSNIVVVIASAVLTFGFCKLTGKCSSLYEDIHVGNIDKLITAQNLEVAQGFLVRAVEKYAEEVK